MPRNSSAKTVPDTYIKTDFRQIFATVFGTEDAPNDAQTREEAIRSLPLEDQIGLAAYLGRRIQEFSDIFAVAARSISEQPPTAFADENCLISVSDDDTGETVGGISVASETTLTTKKRIRNKLLEELTKANLQGQFTKTSVELQKDALLSAKADGTLPASIDSLLPEAICQKRTVKFKKLISPNNIEED